MPPPPEIITKAEIEASFPGVTDVDGWVLAVESAQADAESTFREKAAACEWPAWSTESKTSPWWEAAAEYVWTLIQAHIMACNERGQSPARLEEFLGGQILVLGDRVFRKKLLATSSVAHHPDSVIGLNFVYYAKARFGDRLQQLLLCAWKEHAARLKIATPVVGTTREPAKATDSAPRPCQAEPEHESLVMAVKRIFGGTGNPTLASFYGPLGVKNSEFVAWTKQDHKHCGRKKRELLNQAAGKLQ